MKVISSKIKVPLVMLGLIITFIGVKKVGLIAGVEIIGFILGNGILGICVGLMGNRIALMLIPQFLSFFDKCLVFGHYMIWLRVLKMVIFNYIELPSLFFMLNSIICIGFLYNLFNNFDFNFVKMSIGSGGTNGTGGSNGNGGTNGTGGPNGGPNGGPFHNGLPGHNGPNNGHNGSNNGSNGHINPTSNYHTPASLFTMEVLHVNEEGRRLYETRNSLNEQSSTQDITNRENLLANYLFRVERLNNYRHNAFANEPNIPYLYTYNFFAQRELHDLNLIQYNRESRNN